MEKLEAHEMQSQNCGWMENEEIVMNFTINFTQLTEIATLLLWLLWSEIKSE